MKNKEILEKLLKSHRRNISAISSRKNDRVGLLRAISSNINGDNGNFFIPFSYEDNPFSSGLKSIFEIFESNFTHKMQEMADIHLEEALLSDTYKVQIDMRNTFEKLIVDVPRERKETSAATSK